MTLKSFGCSFTFGTDLIDDGRDGPFAIGSRLTWPALLANYLGHEYQCYARPGSGNLQILERLLNQVTNIDLAVYVVNWTWIERFDYIDENLTWPGTKWNTVMPIDTDAVATTYYKHLHNQYSDKLTTLLYIRLAIDTLKQRQLPFIMTYMDELIFETEWHTTPAVLELQDYIRPYMTTFNGQTFLNYSKEKGFPISETLHPLESAHQSAFELIKSYNLV